MAHEGYERKRVTNELVKEGLAAGSPFRMRVASGSMIPALRVGDEVVIEKRDWRELRAGDIVLCELKGLLLLHRLIAVRTERGQTRLITKGDALWDFDQPSSASDYLGKAVRVERGGKSLALEGRMARVTALAQVMGSVMRAISIQLYRTMKKRILLVALLGMALFALGLSGVSAAVTISAFTATGGDSQITLNWVTVSELKNFGFNVERSTNPSDPNGWTKIAFVPSQSPCVQSLTTLTYSYKDNNLLAGTKYFYRLQLFGSPCGDPNTYYEKTVSATTSGTAAPTATATTPPTATPLPTATATSTPTAAAAVTETPTPTGTSAPAVATATHTATPLPAAATATPTRVPPTPTRGAGGGGGATRTATPRAIATATARPNSPTPEPSSEAVEATPTLVAMVAPTEAPPSAPSAAPERRGPSQPEPSPAPSNPNRTLVGIGLVTVLGMGAIGFFLLIVAGLALWQYYKRR